MECKHSNKMSRSQALTRLFILNRWNDKERHDIFFHLDSIRSQTLSEPDQRSKGPTSPEEQKPWLYLQARVGARSL